MKSFKLYQHLKEIATRFDITVSEQNLRTTGVNARSGLCKIKGEQIFIMDKHLSDREKAQALSDCLREFPLNDIYIIPAIRKFLEPA